MSFVGALLVLAVVLLLLAVLVTKLAFLLIPGIVVGIAALVFFLLDRQGPRAHL